MPLETPTIEQPKPAATPTPAPAPSPAPSPNADDDFGALHGSIKPPSPTPPQPPTPPEPDPGKGTTPPAKPSTPPATTPKGTPTVPKELRAELDRVKTELAAKNKAQADLEAKIKDYEARGKDTTALVEQMKERDTRIEQLQAEVRALKHETDPAFKAKYDKPFNDAAALAEQDIKSMQIVNEAGEAVRPATFEDLNKLWLIYKESPSRGIAEAKSLFGEDATIITDHLKELRRLDYARNQALADERKNWKERQEKEQAEQVTKREGMTKLMKQVEKELADSVDEYHDAPDDKEMSDLRAKGYAILDSKPQSFQQHALRQAHVRHMVAAFGPLKLKVVRLEQKLADAASKIEELEGKKPSGGKRSGGETAPKDDNLSWEDRARKELA